MRQVFADFAAATPTDSAVVRVMAPYWRQNFANPSSVHQFGGIVSRAVSQARQTVAKFLNCTIEEIYFTSSGTESNNLAILGVARANRRSGNHLITTSIEHRSVLHACRALERDGWEVTYLPINQQGLVSPDDLKKAITERTVLVSIHLANSEIGAIQPIGKLAKITKEKHILFHTDACQAAAYLELDVKKLGVDLLTFNSNKLYGPKGIAALYVREGVAIWPLIYGGGQEGSLRSGTENVPGIIGLAKAVEIADQRHTADSKRIGQLRDRLQAKLANLPGVKVNVAAGPRLANHLSVTLNNAKRSDLVTAFDQEGIAVSSGSACSAKTQTDSHVLTAIGLTRGQINKTVRITLGRPTSMEDLERIISAAKKISRPS